MRTCEPDLNPSPPLDVFNFESQILEVLFKTKKHTGFQPGLFVVIQIFSLLCKGRHTQSHLRTRRPLTTLTSGLIYEL